MTDERTNYKLSPECQVKINNLKKILENRLGMEIPCTQVIYYSVEQALKAESKGAEA